MTYDRVNPYDLSDELLFKLHTQLYGPPSTLPLIIFIYISVVPGYFLLDESRIQYISYIS